MCQLLDLLNHVIDMEILPWNTRIFEYPEHVYERVMNKSLVVDLKMDSVQSFSHLHEIFSILILCCVLKAQTDLEEGFVILLLQIQLKERSEYILWKDRKKFFCHPTFLWNVCLAHVHIFIIWWLVNWEVKHSQSKAWQSKECILFEVLVCGILDDPVKELNDVKVFLVTALKEMLEWFDMPHDYDKNFDYFCEEVLIWHLMSWFHLLVDDVPNPSHVCVASISSLRKEGLNELFNQLLVEDTIELRFAISTLEGNRHECELKHVVFGLIAAGACLNLGKSCLKNLNLTLVSGFVWDFNRAESHKGFQVNWNVAEEIFEKIE